MEKLPFFDKKYKMKTVDQFEDYMKFLGVNMLVRKAALSMHPEVVLTKNSDGSYTYTITTPLKTQKSTFRLGEEVEDDRLDGAKVKSVWKLEGNKLIETQVDGKGKTSTITRNYSGDTLTVTITAEGWDGICTRVYELVK